VEPIRPDGAQTSFLSLNQALLGDYVDIISGPALPHFGHMVRYADVVQRAKYSRSPIKALYRTRLLSRFQLQTTAWTYTPRGTWRSKPTQAELDSVAMFAARI